MESKSAREAEATSFRARRPYEKYLQNMESKTVGLSQPDANIFRLFSSDERSWGGQNRKGLGMREDY